MLEVMGEALRADGTLPPELLEQLKREFVAEEGKDLTQAQRDAMTAAFGEVLQEFENLPIMAVSAKSIRKLVETCIDRLEGLSKGIRSIAIAIDHDGEGGPSIYELGGISTQLQCSQAMLEAARDGLNHFIECACSPAQPKAPEAKA